MSALPAPAYTSGQYADRVYPELMRAKRAFDIGLRRLQNALDRCPGGYTHSLLELAETAAMDDLMPNVIGAFERVTDGEV